ncbi:unnamed protein product [Cercospora beticola]|nr:unnamed protein product [Cercospora beticola]
MKSFIACLFALQAFAAGTKHTRQFDTYRPCDQPGQFGFEPVCCDDNVVGGGFIACESLEFRPRDAEEFSASCGRKKPTCCMPNANSGPVNEYCGAPAGFEGF